MAQRTPQPVADQPRVSAASIDRSDAVTGMQYRTTGIRNMGKNPTQTRSVRRVRRDYTSR